MENGGQLRGKTRGKWGNELCIQIPRGRYWRRWTAGAARCTAIRTCNQREINQAPACICNQREINQAPACIYDQRQVYQAPACIYNQRQVYQSLACIYKQMYGDSHLLIHSSSFLKQNSSFLKQHYVSIGSHSRAPSSSIPIANAAAEFIILMQNSSF